MNELAWHFVRDDRRLLDGSRLVTGEWMESSGPLVLGGRGLHASTLVVDALRYAPGPVACRVEVGGDIIRGGDKIVCSRRRALWAVDATRALGKFARRCALDGAGLWNCPSVVRRYLVTGDESIRDASLDATRSSLHERRSDNYVCDDCADDADNADADDDCDCDCHFDIQSQIVRDAIESALIAARGWSAWIDARVASREAAQCLASDRAKQERYLEKFIRLDAQWMGVT